MRGQLADSRARMTQLLQAAGADGAGPQALAEQLQAEGHDTVRQTVAAWLTDLVDTGHAVRVRRGVYVHRDHHSP